MRPSKSTARPRARARSAPAPASPTKVSSGGFFGGVALRIGLTFLALGILNGLGYAYLQFPRGEAALDRLQHLSVSDVEQGAVRANDQVRARVVYFLNTPTVVPPTPTPTPQPRPTRYPTPTPRSTIVPTSTLATLNPALTAQPASGAQLDAAGRTIQSYVAAVSQGDRVGALQFWNPTQGDAAVSLIDSALKRGDRYQVTDVRETRSPFSSDVLQVEVVADVTAGTLLAKDVHQVYQLQLLDSAWRITARLQ